MSISRNAAANGRWGTAEIIFVGYALKFSRIHMRLLQEEHSSIHLSELRDVESLLMEGVGDECRLILIDHSECDAVIENAPLIAREAARVRIAITYDGPSLDQECMRSCLASNAVDSFLPMDMNIETWISAVDLLLHGGRYIPPSLLENLLLCGSAVSNDDASVAPPPELNALTKRELEVLELVARGHQNKQIAFQLNLSQNTVKQHLHHIITKLNASNRTEAAACYHVQMARQRSSGHAE